MRVHVLIWQFLDSSYKFLIMSVPNVSSISERGGKSPFLQRWLKVHQSFKLFELSVIYISGRNLVRLSGYEEISCFKFNSVSYDQKKTEGNYVYTCKPDQSILRRKMCTFWFPFTKKKKKKKIIYFTEGTGEIFCYCVRFLGLR